MDLVVEKEKFVSVRIDNVNASRFFFPDLNELRNKIVTKFISYDPNEVFLGPNGASPISATNWLKSYVTLVDCLEVNFISKMPIVTLSQTRSSGKTKVIKPRILNLSRCFVEIPAAAALAVDQEIFFSFYYKD